jgi:RNA polymerase sigma-70 factor (sigma-E family)
VPSPLTEPLEARILDGMTGSLGTGGGEVASDIGRNLVPEPRVATRSAAPTIEELFEAHYARLVHLARHLLDEPNMAEDIVMDAYESLSRQWGRVRDPDAALGYLRACVVNGSRSRLRRQLTARRRLVLLQGARAITTEAAAEHVVLSRYESEQVFDAVRRLPTRQRQVLVLRYYEELSVAAVAELLGCSTGSIKTHAYRGLRALAGDLGWSR